VGQIEEKRQRNKEALAAYTEAETLYRSSRDRRGQAAALVAIGDLEQTLQRATKAHEAYARAVEVYRESGDHTGQAQLLTRMAKLVEPTDRRRSDEYLAQATKLMHAAPPAEPGA
jgi:tetratricopeptide (TPR) repeat protein